MKSLIPKKRNIAVLMATFFNGLGVLVANFIAKDETIVKGILGMAIVILLFPYSKANNTNETLDSVFVFPKNLLYFALAFFGATVTYWSVGYIYAMVVFLIRK